MNTALSGCDGGPGVIIRRGVRVTPGQCGRRFIAAALDADVPLRDVQEAASRARTSLDWHATYIASAEGR